MTSNKILKLKDVKQKTGLSKSTIYHFISHNKFPTQITIGIRAVGWLEHEIEEWLSHRILQSRKATSEAI